MVRLEEGQVDEPSREGGAPNAAWWHQRKFPEQVILSFLLKRKVKDRQPEKVACSTAEENPVQMVSVAGVESWRQLAVMAENEGLRRR